jgi:replicative DNA helicase
MRMMRDVMTDYMDSLQRKLEGEKHYMSSGFHSLDRFLPAWLHDGHLIVVAGRPGMGKSIFGQMIAEGVAESGFSALEITLEMSSYELAERSLCRRTGVPLAAFKTGEGFKDSDWPLIAAAHDHYSKLSFLIDDASFDIGPMIHKVKAAAASLDKAELPPLKCLVVDYLQLVGASGANRNLEITQITGALKRLAKELQIPVVALSQLNRGVEGRQDKRPLMSDLRESGAIEQDADLILFLYRDEYYTKEACTEPGIAEIISAKNRHGPTGTLKMAFLGERMMFGDLAHE